MDPGSCLNWMLERASGRDFSYVHTDNNLHLSYERKMRAALTVHPLALAHCHMRTIDEAGRHVNVYRRGSFDLARLVSVNSLGRSVCRNHGAGRSRTRFQRARLCGRRALLRERLWFSALRPYSRCFT